MILILSPDNPIMPMGGVGVHLMNVLKHISRKDISVVCPSRGDYKIADISVYGINHKLDNCDVHGIGTMFLMQQEYVMRVMSLYYKEKLIDKIDLIYCIDWSTTDAAMDLAKYFGCKVIFAIHLSIALSNEKKSLDFIDKEIACHREFMMSNIANKIIHVSGAYLNEFEFLPFMNKSVVIPNGVDYDSFKTDEAYDFGTDKKVILYIGRLAYMKNIKTLASINVPDDYELIFCVSKNGNNDEIRKLIEYKFRIINGLYGKDKINAISSADIVIMPSIHEPFGMVALEALAAGQNKKTMLLSSYVGGMGEFLNTDNSIYCGTTKESIEKAINEHNQMDEDTKAQIRKNGCDVAQKYSWQNTADLINKEINNLI